MRQVSAAGNFHSTTPQSTFLKYFKLSRDKRLRILSFGGQIFLEYFFWGTNVQQTFENTFFQGTNVRRCLQCNVFYVRRIFRFSISLVRTITTTHPALFNVKQNVSNNHCELGKMILDPEYSESVLSVRCQ